MEEFLQTLKEDLADWRQAASERHPRLARMALVQVERLERALAYIDGLAVWPICDEAKVSLAEEAVATLSQAIFLK